MEKKTLQQATALKNEKNVSSYPERNEEKH